MDHIPLVTPAVRGSVGGGDGEGERGRKGGRERGERGREGGREGGGEGERREREEFIVCTPVTPRNCAIVQRSHLTWDLAHAHCLVIMQLV